MISLNACYTHDRGMGYGRMGCEIVDAFKAMGINVIDGLTPDTQTAPVALWMSLPNNNLGWREGQYRVILTMQEATELPPLHREGLDNYDLVLVPSEQNLELFRRYHKNVHYVPLGVNPEKWYFRKRPPLRQTFRFLVDGRGRRKGTDIAVRAFKAAFDGRYVNHPRPQLMVKGNRGGVVPTENIRIVPSGLTEEEELGLYASAHCYLAPSRGEGWGMQPLQAIAQGCPTILTKAHGHLAFSDLGWGVHAEEVPADPFVFGDSGNWWEPDLEQMVENMRWMYDNYELACSMAQLFSEDALAEFTWKETAADIDGIIEQNITFGVHGDWVTPSYRFYRVIVLLPHKCEIAGTTYVFEPGKVYYETGEVKRILFEAGLLDPRCADMDDSGLTPTQTANIGAMSAQNGHCPTCGQTLNSKPLHELEEAVSH